MKTQKLMMVLGSVLITLTLMAAIRAGFDGPQPPLNPVGASPAVSPAGVAAATPDRSPLATTTA